LFQVEGGPNVGIQELYTILYTIYSIPTFGPLCIYLIVSTLHKVNKDGDDDDDDDNNNNNNNFRD